MITRKLFPVKIVKAALDMNANPPVLRGVIDPVCLPFLQVDSYQRDPLAPSARKEIRNALESGESLPDIEIGMRGDRFDMPDDHTVDLLDPTFIIDGYQRVTTVREYLDRFPNAANTLRLGVVVHFATNQEYERKRFRKLNLFRRGVSSSVLLRNEKEDHPLIASLYGLTEGGRPGDLLHRRVCWSQNMTRGELISGLMFVQVTLELHRRFVAFHSSVKALPDATDRLMHEIGLTNARANVLTFWELVNSAWGVRAVQQKGATHLKASFLNTLAKVFAEFRDFWVAPDNKKFVVPYELKRKLAQFRIDDPEIARLCQAGGRATTTLYFHLVKYLNSGKRTKRLRPWDPSSMPPSLLKLGSVEDEDEEVNVSQRAMVAARFANLH